MVAVGGEGAAAGAAGSGRVRSLRLNKVLLQHVGITVLASLLLVGAFGAAGMAPRPLWFVAAALAIGFGSLAIRLIAPQVLETSWPGRATTSSWPRCGPGATTTGPSSSPPGCRSPAASAGPARVRRRSSAGSVRCCSSSPPIAWCTATASIPTLEPDRARAITGDRLWGLITGDEKRTASLDEIEYAIHTIENL